MAKRPETSESGLFIAWQSFAVELPDRSAPVVTKGTRLRGDDPVVIAAPQYFVADGASRAEMAGGAAALDNANPRPMPEAPARETE
jgi:hypothetical protein